ncbi:Lipoprotein LipO precursor [Paenibacillus konkukensis]|uniref:Lipoprotein LipO n=2 Tax=Paenibacillus konkukensis TaxID=2020716 RepID=A0ABY4S2K8_9BACL|nr:Lipoprotein LipO precursor [Paenibacillus konkukensis]
MKTKSIMLAGLVAALAAGAFGCSKGPAAANGDKSAAAAGNDGKKSLQVEIIRPGSNLPTPDKDVIKQEMDKALGASYNMTVYASLDDYKNQLNVRLTAGNYPDLFLVDRQMLSQYVKQNLVLDLDKYKDKLKPALDFIGDAAKNGMIDGKLYAISHTQQKPMQSYFIRKDWLDLLGLKPPANLEELKAVAKAFTEKDPDGNGKQDTIGITGSKLETFQPIFGAFNIAMPGSFVVKDGKVTNSLFDPAMKDALSYIQGLIQDKVVDPELLGNTGMQHQQKAIMGQAGIIYIDWANLTKEQIMEQIKTVNPKAEWIPLTPPAGPGGQWNGTWDIGTSPYIFSIPKALEKNPDKLQKVFDLINYVADQQTGGLLVQYGVKGKHYNMEGDKIVPTELMGKEVGYSWLYQFTGRPEIKYLQSKFASQAPYIDFYNKQPRIEALNGFVTLPEGFNKTDVDRYVEEEFAKFIYGKRSLQEYDSFANTLKTTMNYQAYLDAAQKQLKQMGYGN